MAMLWQVFVGDAAVPPVRILRLDLDYALNREALVRMHLESVLGSSLYPGQVLVLRVRERVGDQQVIHELQLHLVTLAMESGRTVVVARFSPCPFLPLRERTRVAQRAADETVADFVNRLGLEAAFSPPGGEEGPEGLFEDAIPVGSCVILEPGQDAPTLGARLFGRLAHRRPAISGWFQGVNDPSRRWCTHHAGTGDINRYVELDEQKWNLVAPGDLAAGPEDACFLHLIDHRAPEDVFAELAVKEAPTPARMAFGEVDVPLVPTTIRIRGQDSFAFRVRLTLLVDSKGRADHNIEVRLLLRASTAGLSASPIPETTRLLLGRFVSWQADGGRERILAVEPAQVGDVTEAELRPLADWEFAPGGGGPPHLLAPLVAPGFVREAHSAFYSAWGPGDLLLVSIAEGQLPVALGALHRVRTAIAGNGGLEVALMGTRVRLDAVTASGSSEGNAIELGIDGTVCVQAAKKTTIKGSTLIDGTLEVP